MTFTNSLIDLLFFLAPVLALGMGLVLIRLVVFVFTGRWIWD